MKKLHRMKEAAVILVGLVVVSVIVNVQMSDDADTVVFATEERDEKTETAQSVHDVVDGFLEAFINQDSTYLGEGGVQKYHEVLAPYVNEELLSKLAPSAEEMEEMSGGEYAGEVPIDEEMDMDEYSRELADRQIFIHYESLDSQSNTISATAYTINHHKNPNTHYDLYARVHLELEEEDGNWGVETFAMEQLSTAENAEMQ